MTHWLIPANTKFYDVLSAFAQDTTYWPMNANLSSGDIVYIYLAAPYKQIGYVCSVLETGYTLDEISDNIMPFIKAPSNKNRPSKPFMQLKTLRAIPLNKSCNLSLNNLQRNGLNGMLMGARKLENNPELLIYIGKNSP